MKKDRGGGRGPGLEMFLQCNFFFLKDLGISISFLLTAFLQLENCSSFNNRAGCKTSSNFDKLASFKRKGV